MRATMKGLEQAVNIKLWPGNAEPVKAWGKLKRVSMGHFLVSMRESLTEKARDIHRVNTTLTSRPRIRKYGMKAETH